VFFFPWDFSWCVRRAFDRLHPQLCILMELEVWHNFTELAAKRAIPVVVANGRISSGKGFPRYRKIAPLVRPMFRRLSLVLTQDREYADRFEFLGVPAERIKVVGSLKYDTAEVTNRVEGAESLAGQLRLDPDEKFFVAGSTGPGEEEILLNCLNRLKNEFTPPPRLIIVPRKPERFDEVARLIESRGLPLIRYSRIKSSRNNANIPAPAVQSEDSSNLKSKIQNLKSSQPSALNPQSFSPDAVILGDTMGDLRKFYSLAHVIFVGRSLVPMGGSDMIEAAALAKPVIVGPHTDNFTESVEILKQADAIQIVSDQTQLDLMVCDLLRNDQRSTDMGRRAQQAVIAQQGATRKSIEAIVEVLENHKRPIIASVTRRASSILPVLL
jgi:3-deoxy-D-manno-octulosonic-acid transferase